MKPAGSAYQPHIDGLRAVAVLAVLAYHAFPRGLPGGFVGVDVFFVISGFLITGILIGDLQAPGAGLPAVIRRFYARRVRRIFPALIVVLLACYILGFLLLLPDDLVVLSGRILASAGFYLNFVLARGLGYFDAKADSDPLLHLWSLGVEEQFYLVWPLVLWACLRLKARFLPGILFVAGCSYFWNAQKAASADAAAFFLPQTRLWELGMGAAGAALLPPLRDWLRPPSPPTRGGRLAAQLVPALGLGLILLSFFLVRNTDDYPNRWALAPTVGAALVVGSSGAAWVNRRILSNRAAVGIGLVSYPLYLWHWPLLSFAHRVLERADSGGVRLACLALALVLAWLTYRFVETPVRRTAAGRRTTAALVAALGSVVVLGGVTVRYRAFPGRFSPVLKQLAEFRFDRRTAWREGTYFLDPGQDPQAFRDAPEENVAGKPTLFLWGDSYAASLYPGIREVYGARYNVVQRTAALTGAFVSTHDGHRDVRNGQFVLAAIRRRRPEVVVIAGQWQSYDWRDVADTLAALRSAGVPRVILVGPEPEWAGGLSQQLYNYMWRHPREELPERLKSGLVLDVIRPIDRELRQIAGANGAEYVSPLEIFGNRDGFLVRTGPRADSLTAFDGGHLTTAGAVYLVSRFPRR